MADTLWLDTETFSEVPIREGTDRYARAAEILICSYALNDDPVSTWDRANGEPLPVDLAEHLANPNVLVTAHNAAFDEAVLRHAGLQVAPERWRCTVAQARAHSLPGSLEKLGEIYGLSEDDAKLKDGRRVMLLFCTPRPKKQKLRRATKQTHPQDWELFVKYCEQDVHAMRFVSKLMPKWNYSGAELALWHLDQRINRRGFAVDTDFVRAAIETAEEALHNFHLRTQDLTTVDGVPRVQATTQRDVMLQHLLEDYGIHVENLQASTVEDILERQGADLPPPVAELLSIRLQVSSTSVSKYKRLSAIVGPDGRCRYTKEFCGAARTGRWAGRGFQPDNLPRPMMAKQEIEDGIDAVKLGLAALIYPKPMTLLSSAVRGAITAPPGKKLCIADLSNIEGRVLAWLAGEAWKLAAYRDYDTIIGVDERGKPIRKGHDLYALSYARPFGVSPETVMDNYYNGDGSMRQIGKVMELALGFEGGVGAFVTFALAYNIDLDAMAASALSTIPEWAAAEAFSAWQWATSHKRTYGLSQDTYIVCDAFKRMWRRDNPAIACFWKDVEIAVRGAIALPNTVREVGKLRIAVTGRWLRIQLPSGRALCYPNARVNDDNKICYDGINQYTRKWGTICTYSGKLVENVTQGVSRDKLGCSMPRIEAAGYDLVMHVHDEVLSEVPDTEEYTHAQLARLLAEPELWCEDLPLAAAGFTTYRYRKG